MDVLSQGLPTATNTMEVLHSAVKVFGNVCFGNLKKGPSVKNISLKDTWVCPTQISVLYNYTTSKQGKLGHS